MKKTMFFLLLLLVGFQGVQAQEFVVNPWGAEELKCYGVTWDGWEWKTAHERYVMLEEGYTFQCVDTIDSDYCIFEYEDKYYAARTKGLKFSSGNPEGMENPLSEEVQIRATPVGEFYGSMSAVYSVLAIFAVAMFFVFLYLKSETSFLRGALLVVIPLAILAVSAIEVYGYYLFEDDIFWWCDYELYGFWGTLLRLIPFALLLVAQLLSIKVYKEALPHELSIKPAAISLGICIPLSIAVAIVMALMNMQSTPAFDIVVNATFFISLGIGVVKTLVRNISACGLFSGIFETLFILVYIISCIITVVAFISFSFKVIMMLLAACFVILLLFGMINGGTSKKRVFIFVEKD